MDVLTWFVIIAVFILILCLIFAVYLQSSSLGATSNFNNNNNLLLQQEIIDAELLAQAQNGVNPVNSGQDAWANALIDPTVPICSQKDFIVANQTTQQFVSNPSAAVVSNHGIRTAPGITTVSSFGTDDSSASKQAPQSSKPKFAQHYGNNAHYLLQPAFIANNVQTSKPPGLAGRFHSSAVSQQQQQSVSLISFSGVFAGRSLSVASSVQPEEQVIGEIWQNTTPAKTVVLLDLQVAAAVQDVTTLSSAFVLPGTKVSIQTVQDVTTLSSAFVLPGTKVSIQIQLAAVNSTNFVSIGPAQDIYILDIPSAVFPPLSVQIPVGYGTQVRLVAIPSSFISQDLHLRCQLTYQPR